MFPYMFAAVIGMVTDTRQERDPLCPTQLFPHSWPLELPFGSPLIFSREPFIFTVRLLGQAARRHLHFKKASARGFVSFLFSASLFFSRTWGVSTAVFHLFVFFKVFYHIISHRSQARRSSLSETLTQDTAAIPHPVPSTSPGTEAPNSQGSPRTHGAETGFCLDLSPEAAHPLHSPEAGFSLRLGSAGTRLPPTCSPALGRVRTRQFEFKVDSKEICLFLSHSHRGAKYTDCESDFPNHLWVYVAARPPPGLPISPDTCPDAGTFESQTAPPGPSAAGIAPSGPHAGPATKWTPRGPRSSPRRPGEVAAGAARRGSEV